MYKVVVKGKGNIVARIVADSVNKNGNRITTFELEYHRFIHSELMTHRLFSRNAMSSRAVPVSKMIEQVRNNPATPIHWGKNQAGMQAAEVLVEESLDNAKRQWKQSAIYAASQAEIMSSIGSHKQIVNRLLEPFQMMKTVLTATEFDNFFWLRCDSDAQPEIQELAKCMFDAMRQSQPEVLESEQWHTPYVEHIFKGGKFEPYCLTDEEDNVIKLLTEEEAKAISASCCAQVSYRTLNNTYEKAMDIYSKLASGRKVHASPFEHVAKPMGDSPSHEDGVTHKDNVGNYWSGNFKGWIQLRQTLNNHVCWDYKE
jgi:thymidylate synthase ThyX